MYRARLTRIGWCVFERVSACDVVPKRALSHSIPHAVGQRAAKRSAIKKMGYIYSGTSIGSPIPLFLIGIARKQLLKRLARSALEFQHQGFVADHGQRPRLLRQPRPAVRSELSYTTCNAASGQKVPGIRRVDFLAPNESIQSTGFCRKGKPFSAAHRIGSFL